MAASAATLLGSAGSSYGPMLSAMPSTRVVPVSFNLGTYAAGGVNVPTIPGKTGTLVGILVMNPIDADNDWAFGWNGLTSDPEIDGVVISTGAEIGAVDVSSHTLNCLFFYQD